VPTLTLIAGPNGAGKSTITRFVEIDGIERLLDPDAIAHRINPDDLAKAAIAAGREVIRRQTEYFRAGLSYAVETTLAGSRVNLAEDARKHGFEVHLLYVGIDTPELSILRIRERVRRGGHLVPDDDVRRRYGRSMQNAAQLTLSADIARLYDNSDDGHRLVLIAKSGRITFRADPLPSWLAGWPLLTSNS
jgi:predicted ABC-type ATPase